MCLTSVTDRLWIGKGLSECEGLALVSAQTHKSLARFLSSEPPHSGNRGFSISNSTYEVFHNAGDKLGKIQSKMPAFERQTV